MASIVRGIQKVPDFKYATIEILREKEVIWDSPTPLRPMTEQPHCLCCKVVVTTSLLRIGICRK